MSIARRFLTGFRQTETNEPGLELNEDGTVDLVNPDGSRTALPGGSISLLGPFSVSFDTPGFINPDNNGINTIAIPAGTMLLDVIPVGTADWTGSVPHDQLIASVLADPAGSGPTFAQFELLGQVYSPVALVANFVQDSGLNGGSVEALDWASQKRPVLALEDCHIVLAAYPEGPITAGSLDLYALVIAT